MTGTLIKTSPDWTKWGAPLGPGLSGPAPSEAKSRRNIQADIEAAFARRHVLLGREEKKRGPPPIHSDVEYAETVAFSWGDDEYNAIADDAMSIADDEALDLDCGLGLGLRCFDDSVGGMRGGIQGAPMLAVVWPGMPQPSPDPSDYEDESDAASHDAASATTQEYTGDTDYAKNTPTKASASLLHDSPGE